MRITESTVTKLVLTELDRLDPVTVIMEDLGKTQGKLTVDCYGKAWTGYWSFMGDGGIAKFLDACDVGYIAGKIFEGDQHVIDYDSISDATNSDVCRDSMMMYIDELVEAYGPDWRMDLPTKTNDDYDYLCRILTSIKAAITQHCI